MWPGDVIGVPLLNLGWVVSRSPARCRVRSEVLKCPAVPPCGQYLALSLRGTGNACENNSSCASHTRSPSAHVAGYSAQIAGVVQYDTELCVFSVFPAVNHCDGLRHPCRRAPTLFGRLVQVIGGQVFTGLDKECSSLLPVIFYGFQVILSWRSRLSHPCIFPSVHCATALG